MTPSLSSPNPPDPACAVCSKPLVSEGFVQTTAGDVVHIGCRSHQIRVDALDNADRARPAIERSAALVEETRRRRVVQYRDLTRQNDRCPVCGEPATLTDWRPHLDWMTVEDCACNGFFVWTPLFDEGRLGRLTPEDREILSQRIRHLHGSESEAWLTTRDATVMGALILRTERPDRPR